MSKNICKNCGTENEEEYIYCKNCGFAFEKERPKNDGETFSSAKFDAKGGSYYSNGRFCVDNIDGIATEEISAFVGKNADRIVSKFSKMEISKSKVSWCWPAALLGYFLGPLGAAIWFFYRKMYKIAGYLVALGVALAIIVSVLNFSAIDLAFDKVYSSFAGGDLDVLLESIEEIADSSETATTLIAQGIEEIANTATCIICGILGFYFYKKHCVNKIHVFRFIHNDQRYYYFNLSAVGGVSGGMMALGIVIMTSINYIISFATMLISIMIIE